MIAIDLEMSGIDEVKCGIIEIGAVEIENPKNQFFQNAKLDEDEELINIVGAKKTVTDVTGQTEEDMREKTRQTQKELLKNFFSWVEKTKEEIFVCQNYMDISFLSKKAIKHGLYFPHFKFIDLHTIGQTIYYQKNKRLLKERGVSRMGLSKVMELCGLKDERKEHNAIEDAKITAECTNRLLNKKNLLEEYKEYKIPKEIL